MRRNLAPLFTQLAEVDKRDMKNMIFWLEPLFNLGTRSGMPRYVAFLCLLLGIILLVPETAWRVLGVNLVPHISSFPAFVQIYATNTDYKNAILIFWLLSPVVLVINTVQWIVKINLRDYTQYLQRRSVRLKSQKKTSDYSFMLGVIIFVAFYAWVTFGYVKEPIIFGGYNPSKSRLMMFLFHGFTMGLMLPMCITFLIAELRANLSSAPM